MDPKSLVAALTATKLRITLVGLLAVGVLLGGAVAIGLLGVPSIAAMENTFGEVTEEETTIETDLVISNPNPIGVTTDDVAINYSIAMNSIDMAYGWRDGIAIGTGNSTVDLRTQLRNDAIPAWWVSHIQNDERTTIDIDATVTAQRFDRSRTISHTHEIETDLISAFNSDETRPVNADSPLTDDPVLYINETSGQWGSVTEHETPIDMAFVVYNPNIEPYVITELGYDISMNDVDVGAGETHEEHIIQSHSTATIGLSTVIDNEQLDDWWVTHLDETIHGHQVSELRIEFYAVVELPTGEAVTVPLDEFTYEETIETDIFDEGGDVDEPVGSGDADEDSTDEDGSTPGTDTDEEGADDDGGDEAGDVEEGDDDDGDEAGDDEDEGDDDEDDGLPL